jgi:hypothetical protein
MTDISLFTNEVALTLFERHGKSAMVYVDEQVKLALRRADWLSVKSWRYVGGEIEKLTRFHGNVPARSRVARNWQG